MTPTTSNASAAQTSCSSAAPPFEGFSSYWPGIVSAPADPENRALSEVNRELSRIYNQLPKAVVSDNYIVPEDNAWRHQTTVIAGTDVSEWVGAARGQGSGDILVFGSRTMWNSLLDQALVDELHLMVSPNGVGSGTPIFDSAGRPRPAGGTSLRGIRQCPAPLCRQAGCLTDHSSPATMNDCRGRGRPRGSVIRSGVRAPC